MTETRAVKQGGKVRAARLTDLAALGERALVSAGRRLLDHE